MKEQQPVHPLSTAFVSGAINKNKIVTAEEAVNIIKNGDVIGMGGFVGSGQISFRLLYLQFRHHHPGVRGLCPFGGGRILDLLHLDCFYRRGGNRAAQLGKTAQNRIPAENYLD